MRKNNNSTRLYLVRVYNEFNKLKCVERSLIRERQREGIALAKKKGLYKGRKPSLSQEQVTELKRRVENGDKKSDIAKDLKISRETLYQYLRKYKN